MKAYIAFTKKEFLEFTRTWKLLIIGAVFLLFGMMSPVTAKVMPDILKSVMPEGMEITLGDPTALDSWAQFYKNVGQMGLVVLVIVFSGLLSGEFSRGTLVNMLTKGLRRPTVILSKLSMAVSVWTGAYVLCFGVTWVYTEYFWPGNNLPNLVFAAFCLWLFGVVLIAAVLLGGVLFKSSYGALLFTGAVAAALLTANIAPKIADYNPASLAAQNMALLQGSVAAADLLAPALIAAAMVIVFVSIAVLLFDRKQL